MRTAQDPPANGTDSGRIFCNTDILHPIAIQLYCEGMPKIVDPEQRRTEIIHGLWAVIYERGIHAVTYQAVAQAAGVSVGRIQHYFDSKQDLVHAGCRAMVEARPRPRRSAPTPWSRWRP